MLRGNYIPLNMELAKLFSIFFQTWEKIVKPTYFD